MIYILCKKSTFNILRKSGKNRRGEKCKNLLEN